MGRRRRGIDCTRITKHPERRPAEPNPATALPTTKHGRRCGGPAEQRACYRDGVGEQEDALDREERVRFAEHELEGAHAEPEGGRIPADIGDRVEVVCDARHGGGDDVHVYAGQDENRPYGEHDEPEVGAGWVLWLYR